MLYPVRSAGLLVLLLLAAAALPGATRAAPASLTTPARVPHAAAGPDGPDPRFAERFLVTSGAPGMLPPPSIFDGAQVISLYGYPDIPRMGRLGASSPEQAVAEAARLAETYDALNGDRGAVAALHLIVAVAKPDPQDDGSYLRRIPAETLDAYVSAAREGGVLLFLDVQIGWADPLAEVQRLENALIEPFVHLALDPEFATGRQGVAPGTLIGHLRSAEVNAVQEYLAGLVRARRLPPKVLVLHQFRDRMLARPEQYADVPEVEITIDMDGWGSPWAKLHGYESFALAPYSERAAIKLFYGWDDPLLMPADLLALDRPPDLVIYQ